MPNERVTTVYRVSRTVDGKYQEWYTDTAEGAEALCEVWLRNSPDAKWIRLNVKTTKKCLAAFANGVAERTKAVLG